MAGERLLGEENFAGESGVDDGAEAVAFLRGLGDDALEMRAVTEAHLASDTIA